MWSGATAHIWGTTAQLSATCRPSRTRSTPGTAARSFRDVWVPRRAASRGVKWAQQNCATSGHAQSAHCSPLPTGLRRLLCSLISVARNVTLVASWCVTEASPRMPALAPRVHPESPLSFRCTRIRMWNLGQGGTRLSGMTGRMLMLAVAGM